MIYAFRNHLIDYLKIAQLCTELVHLNLGLPVAVVTNDRAFPTGADYTVMFEPEEGTKRHFHEYGESAPWYNRGRERSWDITPFRHTIVMDADYLVMSDTLLKYVDLDLAVSRELYELTKPAESTYTAFGPTGYPSYWASLMVFDKENPVSYEFFQLMKKVKRSWPYFSNLFGLDTSLYRNDHIVAIALYLLHGRRWSKVNDLPLVILNSDHTRNLVSIDKHDLSLSFTGYGIEPPDVLTFYGRDIHVANKRSFLQVIEETTK